MSFRLSSGTLDTMAGIFAPPKKYRMGSGGGNGKGTKPGGTVLGLAVASMFPKPSSGSSPFRATPQAKAAFGGGSHAAISRRAVSTMERTARRVPEVMVRITGRQHGGGHVLANFSYISRLGHGADKELGLYTSEGEVIHDGKEMQVLAQDWHEWEMNGDARRKGATSISIILSMPTGTDPERLKEAAIDFAKVEMANRSWVASLHVDRDHPHVHLTIARRDHDGRRFHPNRDDLFRYRQRFAEKLRDRGIEANATPARARGIDPTHEPIAAKKVRDKGGHSTVDKSRARRVDQLRRLGSLDPVDAVLSRQQAAVRRAYEQSIAELSASPSFAHQIIAKSLERFASTMPNPEPNSVRSARLLPASRDANAVVMKDKDHAVGQGATSDPLTAALARARALREEIEAGWERRDKRRQGDPSSTPERHREAPAHRDRQAETPNDQSPNAALTRMEEILRQVRDRDREREQRNRDRSPDKGGPRR